MIETSRLLLRKPTLADLGAAAAWLGDPEVMDWLGGVEADPRAVLQRWIDEWSRYPTGKFILERLEDGAVVGRVGCNYYDPAGWTRSPDGDPELGWALGRPYWGQGYATEAALAIRNSLSEERVISLITPANRRSQAVARRLGAAPGETVELPDAGPHVIWVHPSAKITQR
jgi:RimJ/RimL family protein N-acetyltransferase